MVRFLQINLNHCWAAQQVLTQTTLERSINVVLISDQLRNPIDDDGWVVSGDGGSAVMIGKNSALAVASKGGGRGFAWIRAGGMHVVSCYCPPRWDAVEFDSFLKDLSAVIADYMTEGVLIVGGDFNAHSSEWGSSTEDVRGRKLSDFAAALGLTTVNEGTSATYRRVNASSVVDVTFVRTGANAMVNGWRVLSEVYSGSDHCYVEYAVDPLGRSTLRHESETVKGWSIGKLDHAKLSAALNRASRVLVDANSEEMAVQMQEYLVGLCEESMPRRVLWKGRSSAHWWTPEITERRRECIAARRRYQRAGRRAVTTGRAVELAGCRNAVSRLSVAIKKSQEKCWSQLCSEVDRDPWGTPYKVVLRRFGRRAVGAAGRELEIARELFPTLPTVDWESVSIRRDVMNDSSEEEDMPFSIGEVLQAVSRLPSGKASGPDGIPNEILIAAVKKRPGLFADMYNKCWASGVFPVCWKLAKLVLLHKGQGKPMDQATSYRPLSLLNGAGKLFERLLLKRIYNWLDAVEGLSPKQFGFHPGRSTLDAVRSVIEIAERAASGPTQYRHLCAVVALDVRNAFNSAPWQAVDEALQRKCAPRRLIRMIRSYLSGRELLVESGGAESRLTVTGGVPQGSVIGPVLWNIFYDGLLRLELPEGAHLIAFADDIAVVTVGHNKELLEKVTNETLDLVGHWMAGNGLGVAPQKSEAVVLTRKWAYTNPVIRYEGVPIAVGRSIRYLGVFLDTRLTFRDHIMKVTAGARKTAVAIGRLMPNVGGPQQAKRRLLATVVNNKLLYAAPIWSSAASGTERNRGALSQAQRVVALRVTRCYRTVSDMAALCLAAMIPAHLLADERRRLERGPLASGMTRAEYVKAEKLATIESWQRVWCESEKGAWTRRLLPDVGR